MKAALTWLVRLAIVTGFVVGVWESANHELGTIRSATSKQIVAHWDLDAAYWSCITSQVESLVPPGQKVWVSDQAPNAGASSKSLWKATAGIRPLSSSTVGVIDLYLLSSKKDRGCLGVHVEAAYPTGLVKYGKGTVSQAIWELWESGHSRQAP